MKPFYVQHRHETPDGGIQVTHEPLPVIYIDDVGYTKRAAKRWELEPDLLAIMLARSRSRER